MTDMVYDYISMGVDMIVTAAVLATVVVILRSSVQLSSYQATLNANSDRVRYYRQYSKYDCTTNLAAADVVGAINYFNYDLEMVIEFKDGHTVYNDPATGTITSTYGGSHPISITALTSSMNASSTFSAWLAEDGKDAPSYANRKSYQGGLITGIKFKEN